MRGAGNLDRLVTIERFMQTGTDPFNQPIETWAALATVWAERKDASDWDRSETLAGGQVGSALMSRFVVRSSDVTRSMKPTDRLTHENATWSIKAVKETADGRRRFVEITAVKDADI